MGLQAFIFNLFDIKLLIYLSYNMTYPGIGDLVLWKMTNPKPRMSCSQSYCVVNLKMPNFWRQLRLYDSHIDGFLFSRVKVQSRRFRNHWCSSMVNVDCHKFFNPPLPWKRDIIGERPLIEFSKIFKYKPWQLIFFINFYILRKCLRHNKFHSSHIHWNQAHHKLRFISSII